MSSSCQKDSLFKKISKEGGPYQCLRRLQSSEGRGRSNFSRKDTAIQQSKIGRTETGRNVAIYRPWQLRIRIETVSNVSGRCSCSRFELSHDLQFIATWSEGHSALTVGPLSWAQCHFKDAGRTPAKVVIKLFSGCNEAQTENLLRIWSFWFYYQLVCILPAPSYLLSLYQTICVNANCQCQLPSSVEFHKVLCWVRSYIYTIYHFSRLTTRPI